MIKIALVHRLGQVDVCLGNLTVSPTGPIGYMKIFHISYTETIIKSIHFCTDTLRR